MTDTATTPGRDSHPGRVPASTPDFTPGVDAVRRPAKVRLAWLLVTLLVLAAIV
ncbi:hypothetical protein G6016_06770, partial [Dietzia aerolata]|nr:hypothetical protein [Dietzia aerolata]